MIDIRKLKELVRLMVDNDLTELDLRDSEEQVTMRRNNPGAMPTVMTAPAVMHVPTAAPQRPRQGQRLSPMARPAARPTAMKPVSSASKARWSARSMPKRILTRRRS